MAKKKRSKTPWIIATVLLLAVAGFATATLSRQGDQAVSVELTATARQQVVETVEAVGRIQPVVSIDLSADVSGKILQLPVKEGDWVEQGQLLVQLDRERYVAEVESAQANLRGAEANVRLAREQVIKVEKDHERLADLHAKNLESQASLDSARASMQVERARAEAAGDNVEQARAALKQAQDSLSKTTIYAPVSGTVSKLNKEVGEIAVGSQFQSDVILTISNLAGMEALVDVDENDVVSLAIGDVATIEVDALPGQRFDGVVTEIASSAKTNAQGTTDQRTEFEVKVALTAPSPELRPGMTASAEIITETREAALAVPLQSVAVRTPEQLVGPDGDVADLGTLDPDREGFVDVVWVVENGRAVAREVETGIQSDSLIEILEGLAEGEQVVTGSYRAISKDLVHGAAVEAKTDAKAG
jgi:HlyD family secretion protein